VHYISCKKENPRYLNWTHKFGIELLMTVKEALELNKKNGNTFWADTIAKEMKDIHVAFKIQFDGKSVPIGYQKIPCHMIFDIKMEDFRCKARHDQSPYDHHICQHSLL
jgi:hypothetical protein